MAVDSQPRLPAPSAAGHWPRAAERLAAVVGSRVEQPRPAVGLRGPHDDDRRIAASPRDQSETRGGCSPDRLASPVTSFTRTGALKVRPPFRLTATKTSVGPSFPAAPQATATNGPAAAIDGFALERPFTASSIESAPLAETAAAINDERGAESARALERNRPDVAPTFRSARYGRPAASALHATASLAEAKRRPERLHDDGFDLHQISPRMRD